MDNVTGIPDIEVSFIIPACNEQEYLPACVDSIHKTMQNMAGYEIIVVDDQSHDNTAEVATSSGCTIVRGAGLGPAVARNTGSRAAHGIFLAFVDADCVLDSNWYAYCFEHLCAPGAVAVGAKISPSPQNATWVENTLFLMNKRRGRLKSDTALAVKWLGTSNLLLRKADFERVGGFDDTLTTCEDYDLCERLAGIGEIIQDRRIHTIHLRESKTLSELYRREFWRGRDSFTHWVRSGFDLYEAPSILLPVGFLLMVSAGSALALPDIKSGTLLLAMALACPALLVLRSPSLKYDIVFYARAFIVAATYLLARGLAAVREVVATFRGRN